MSMPYPHEISQISVMVRVTIYIGCHLFFKVLFPFRVGFACLWEQCGINRSSGVILTLEMDSWRSTDGSDLPRSVLWLLIEWALESGCLTALVLSLICSVTVSLLLDCFWNNCEVFSLCILQIVHQLACSCHYKDSPHELCISIWLKTEKSKDLDLSSILTWKHTTSYMFFFPP